MIKSIKHLTESQIVINKAKQIEVIQSGKKIAPKANRCACNCCFPAGNGVVD